MAILLSEVAKTQLTVRMYDTSYMFNKDSLKAMFTKTTFITAYETQSLIAISHFPELRKTRIKFRVSNTKTTLESRPKPGSVIVGKRKYIIYIDHSIRGNNGILLSAAPYNAQVGVIAHELAHILDYEKKSAGALLKLGIQYLASNNHHRYESAIDNITISRGFGWQLYDWSDFVLNKSMANDRYKLFKLKNYMTPPEIEREMAKPKRIVYND